MLGATISTPVSWGETPEERCKRETEAYNRLWQEDWIRNHPKETGIAVGLRHDDDTPPSSPTVSPKPDVPPTSQEPLSTPLTLPQPTTTPTAMISSSSKAPTLSFHS
ncbi:hypothetical protein LC603019_00976 [Lawsonella clevelandensis]|uniref:Uncharacterized protein n=1 Tax=Lawsonella clevelandensis TaxID=1528099 RepID=A0A5E3ZXB4_9ACTN|nr:hypothetical protein LC603019_00976 [Lawsonella clevelandensis]